MISKLQKTNKHKGAFYVIQVLVVFKERLLLLKLANP